ncbi:hypothetical protein ACQ4LE_002373 [Meloidogyne hapla]|uniref:Uncharacterized protein n=1 Tax=Meloidogyne hapla TaxID=6305 RepID=A0A1I8BFD8_MELHA
MNKCEVSKNVLTGESQIVDEEEEIIEVKVENMKENEPQDVNKEEKIIENSKTSSSKLNQGKIQKKNGINTNVLWKLVRMKYVPRIEFRMCKKCANELYYNKNKFEVRESGKIGIKFDLCENCAKLNMRLMDFLLEFDGNKNK